MTKDYQICTKCVMDTTDIQIKFNNDGVCNHCLEYSIQKERIILTPIEREQKLTDLITKIKNAGRNKEREEDDTGKVKKGRREEEC